MRTLIIADVHANLPALQAVLADAGEISQVWCLGDIVGYGPDPNECIEIIDCLPGLVCIKGNHDAAILDEIPVETFNDAARASLEWLRTQLTDEKKQWLSALPERVEVDEFTLVHGSPRNPVWEYLLNRETARQNMLYFETKFCLVGHTHVPGIFSLIDVDLASIRYRSMVEGEPFSLTNKCIINPGSVGQPRDRDPRPAYMIYDDSDVSWTFQRVAYDIKRVQTRIRSAGLPALHAERLAKGW
ncbi:MAG: metallophosphoesterase family protein [Chloroflexi bacterium]|jgi:diadenosine tetraphosphatase ApaH/serine/threonine PP2A family protein phosphatase|nr:metallophosphoesterase family protein [Chloroflexota bacterium]